jgi:uncharacterized protein (TIGR02646 family)
MRYIDISDIDLPEGGEKKAQAALDKIKNLAPDKRIKKINKLALWRERELKVEFEKLSHGKCWYCESLEARSDNPIDHFRPKGRVAECTDHGGYWWLAFDYRNYRFCCTYCNSRRIDQTTNTRGGKQDHFPILDEEKRAKSPHCNLDEEDPYLLDPTDILDPRLLWFNQDGHAIPKHDKDENEWLSQRAEKSIQLYHLNHYIIRQKRATLYHDIFKFVKDGDWHFKRYLANRQGGKTAEKRSLKLIMKTLRNMMKENSEFSAAAKSYLRSMRSEGREWLETLFIH